MIIFSQALVIAAATDETIDLNAPAIGWRSVVTTSTIAATDAAAAYPVTNLANISTAALWKAANASGIKYLTITPSPAQQMDYIAVARHNFGSAQIAVTVQGREASGDPWSDLVEEFMPTNNNALILRFEKTTYHSIRLRLAVGNAPAQAAVVYAGLLLTMQRRVYVGHVPVTYGRVSNTVAGESESGNFLGAIEIGGYLETAATFNNLLPDWVRLNLIPFLDACRSGKRPFFWAWRPQDYPSETAFCKLTSNPKPENARTNGMMTCSLEMRGFAA
jgi:hypothetical protein